MVLKKRLDYGFSGYRAPVIPRAPRSIRRRGPQKKADGDSQLCPFELLAAVAGKLLQESASSASSNAGGGNYQLGKDDIKQERLEERKALKCERLDLGSCAESIFVSELRAQERDLKSTLKDLTHEDCDSVVGRSSIVTSAYVKSEICENKNAVGNLPAKICGESCDGNIENEVERRLAVDEKQTVDLSFKDPMEICVNTRAFINSDSSVQLPSYRDRVSNTYFPRHRNVVKVGIRDDDEKSVRCNQPSSKIRSFRPQSRLGYRRIRKLLTSKYWKVAPKLKDCELSNTIGEKRKAIYSSRRTLHTPERCQREAPYKRRRLCGHRSTVAYDREASSESISNIPEKGSKSDKSVSAKRVSSSSVVGHQKSFQSRDSHVTLSIKSFKIPELYIEVPQTSTVGSLKRTVMEAVNAILSGGLHVDVLLQGKKVRDDDRTLLQTGILHNGDLDTLGFSLEPSSAQAPPLSPEDPPAILPGDSHQQLIRSPASPITDSGFSNESFNPPLLTNLENHIESNHELVPSSTALSTDETVPDSRALVAVPAMSVEALAMIPVDQKTRRSELGQRRTRRPFSVSEVEALVEAVETLGTGRWRDVKLRAFDNADHRTYVDLKDKWKTLVHTASIGPQQRRGQPVPQELLDRVLSAHAYWSQHQTKQHLKHQIETLKCSETQVVGRVGV